MEGKKVLYIIPYEQVYWYITFENVTKFLAMSEIASYWSENIVIQPYGLNKGLLLNAFAVA